MKHLTLAIAFAITCTTFAQIPPGDDKTRAELVAVLKSPADRATKANACRQLAAIGDKTAVPALAALLTDEDLSHMARYALETLADPSVDAALRDALGKTKGRTQAGIIGSIGVRRDAQAVPALAALLTNPDNSIAQAAARALGKIGTPDAAKALERALASASAANQVAVCEGLLRAAEALAASNQAAPALAIYDRLRATATLPHQVRSAGLRGAILVRGKDGVAILKEALASKDHTQFAAAIATTYEIAAPEVTQALLEQVGKLGADGQVMVFQALALRGDKSALQPALAAAKAGDKAVRIAAIHAVAALGDPSAAPALIALLADIEKEIASAAQESLASLPGKEVDAAVTEMFEKGQPAQRLVAVDLIARRRMTTSVPALMKATTDADAAVRQAAIRQVGEMAGPADLPTLLNLLLKAEGGDTGAAEQAVVSLSQRMDKPDEVIAKLNQLLAEAPAPKKPSVLKVLSSIGGPEALKALRGVLADAKADPALRAAAIRSLGNWKSEQAAPDLLELAKNSSNATEKVLALRGFLTLASRNEITPQERLAMCRQATPLITRPEEKRLLLAALGNIQSPAALQQIAPYFDDAATKEEASAAAVGVVEKMLKGRGPAKVPPVVAQTMEKVQSTTSNPDLAKKAKSLAEQAKKVTTK